MLAAVPVTRAPLPVMVEQGIAMFGAHSTPRVQAEFAVRTQPLPPTDSAAGKFGEQPTMMVPLFVMKEHPMSVLNTHSRPAGQVEFTERYCPLVPRGNAATTFGEVPVTMTPLPVMIEQGRYSVEGEDQVRPVEQEEHAVRY